MPEVLHFRSDVRSLINRDEMLGPDTGGRRLAIKSITYDPHTDMTTMTMRGILPAEFRIRVKPLVEEQVERERIRKVYGG